MLLLSLQHAPLHTALVSQHVSVLFRYILVSGNLESNRLRLVSTEYAKLTVGNPAQWLEVRHSVPLPILYRKPADEWLTPARVSRKLALIRGPGGGLFLYKRNYPMTDSVLLKQYVHGSPKKTANEPSFPLARLKGNRALSAGHSHLA